MRVSAIPYYGGKFSHLGWLMPLINRKVIEGTEIEVFVEPFGGSGAVTLNMPDRFKRVYNDMDEDLVNFFKVLQGRYGERLIRELGGVSYSEDVYVDAIEARKGKASKFDRAKAFYIIARQCRDGMVQKADEKSWSRGKDSVWYNALKKLSLVRERLLNVEIRSQDAISLIKEFDSEDTHFYCDPPYPMESRETGNIYGFETSDKLWVDLAALGRQIEGKMSISSYYCTTIEALFQKKGDNYWDIYFNKPKKSGILRQKKQEILIANYPIMRYRKVYKSQKDVRKAKLQAELRRSLRRD